MPSNKQILHKATLPLFVICMALVTSTKAQWVIDDDGCRTPDGGVGSCVIVNECKIIRDFIQNNWPLAQNDIETIKGYYCGVINNSAKVCCPNSPIVEFALNPKLPIIEQKIDNGCITPDQGAGTCIPIEECETVTEFIESSLPWSQNARQTIQTIQEYQCGETNKSVKVCCPKSKIVVQTVTTTETPIIEQPVDEECTTPDKNTGTCIPIEECKTIIDLFESSLPLSQNARQTIQGYQCGETNKSVKVCCPKSKIVIQTVTTTETPIIEQPLDEKCTTPDKNTGTCIPIEECKTITEFIESSLPLSQNARQTIQGYQCGETNKSVKVCCPKNKIVIQTVTTTETPIIEQPVDEDCTTRDKNTGTCIPIEECKTITEFIESSLPWSQNARQTIQAIQEYQCGETHKSVKVCCPKNKIAIQTVTTTETPIIEQPVDEECTTPDKNTGTCIAIEECKPIAEFIESSSPLSQNSIETIQGYQCGNTNNLVKVCCPIVEFALNPKLPIIEQKTDNGCITPDQGTGTCIPIKECKTITDFIESSSPLSQNSIEILQGYQCGESNKPVEVCCPKSQILIQTINTREPTIIEQSVDEECTTPERSTSFCIPIEECKPVLDFIERYTPLSQYAIQTLQAYQCGNTRNLAKVCCPTVIAMRNLEIPTKMELPRDVTSHNNLNLLSHDCGLPFTMHRIIGGDKTALLEFPWMTLLSYETGRGLDFRCGGTIINEWYILTAAHCITNLSSLKLISVRVGEYNISSIDDCEPQPSGDDYCAPPVQDIAVAEAIPHPKYNSTSITNDIGLIRLAAPINTTRENAKPICLPVTAELRNINLNNTSLTVTGWGVTEKGRRSEDLLKVDVPVVTEEYCRKAYEKSSVVINPKQICAGGRNKSDSCRGDSGGPLLTSVTSNNGVRLVQFGVVSFGPRFCGQEGIPGVYTGVAYYMDWILDNLKP